MTPKQIERYIKHPNECPHCGSGSISGDTPEPMDADVLTRNIFCETCNREWVEIFTLARIVDKGQW